tara:strand:+ start:816 stop:1238 length:423 start_codon:yes stop_codon:yes gene_type:complete
MMGNSSNIYLAIETARLNFKPMKQSGKAQFGKHFTIKDILGSVEHALIQEGVSITHETRIDLSSGVPVDILVTRLVHIPSKTEIKSEVILNHMNRGPQGTGSAITYMRRYTLQTMLNLTPDDSTEDDADFASTGVKRKTI